MRDVKPFFVPPPSAIRATGWQRRVDGDWEPLGDYIEGWDYRTYLVLRCSIDIDVDDVCGAARLTDGSPLAWSIGWRATDTGLVGASVLLDLVGPRSELELTIPPDRAGASVVLTRRLVLRRDRVTARPGEARWAGSILWSDDSTIRLSGQGAAFPTEIIDFRSINWEPQASWFLALPASVDSPAMGSDLMLLINSADAVLVDAVTRTRRHTDVQQSLIDAMEEGIVEEFVRWALARWEDLDDVPSDSVGAAARTLATRVLPDPAAWTGPEIDSMALKAAVVAGARSLGFGRALT